MGQTVRRKVKSHSDGLQSRKIIQINIFIKYRFTGILYAQAQVQFIVKDKERETKKYKEANRHMLSNVLILSTSITEIDTTA